MHKKIITLQIKDLSIDYVLFMRKMGPNHYGLRKLIMGDDSEIDYEIEYLKKYFKTQFNAIAYKLFFTREKISNNGKADLRKSLFSLARPL